MMYLPKISHEDEEFKVRICKYQSENPIKIFKTVISSGNKYFGSDSTRRIQLITFNEIQVAEKRQ